MADPNSSSPIGGSTGTTTGGNASAQNQSRGASTPAVTSGAQTRPTGGAQGSGQEGGIVDRVRDKAAAQLSSQKDRATDGLGSVAQAVRQSTQQLRDQKHDTIAGYVEQAADQIEKFSQRLRDKDVGELLDDAQRLARRQPAVFIGSAFALGVIGARFLKSSSENDRGSYRRGSSLEGSYRGNEYRTRMSSGTGTPSYATANDSTPVTASQIGSETAGYSTGSGTAGRATRTTSTGAAGTGTTTGTSGAAATTRTKSGRGSSGTERS